MYTLKHTYRYNMLYIIKVHNRESKLMGAKNVSGP